MGALSRTAPGHRCLAGPRRIPGRHLAGGIEQGLQFLGQQREEGVAGRARCGADVPQCVDGVVGGGLDGPKDLKDKPKGGGFNGPTDIKNKD